MTPFKFLIFLTCLFAMACKKEAGPNDKADKGILYDTANLGMKINLGEVNRNKWVGWGRNSNEIVVQTEGANNLYQVDIAAKRADNIVFDELVITGRNYDNSSIIVKGRKDNVYGYYLYHLIDRSFSMLLEVDKNVNHLINVSGSSVFVRDGSYSNYFFDLKDRVLMPLPQMSGRMEFLSFSKTGKKTLLGDLRLWDKRYIFDNEKKMMVDSCFSTTIPYFDDEKDLVIDLDLVSSGGLLGRITDVILINAKTKDVIQQFKPSVTASGLGTWSKDGTRLFYLGTDRGDLPICYYDRISGKETLLNNLWGPFSDKLKMYPSDDNRKLLYTPDGGVSWYIKQLQ